jgi:GNAT superfamily N-acetyltransferase
MSYPKIVAVRQYAETRRTPKLIGSDSRILIEPVRTRGALRGFIEFPFKRYRDDPNWVPPLIEERLAFFNRHKNPFWEHARAQLFLARRGDEVAGTIGAVVDDNHNRVHGERMGAFGFFETVDDEAVAGALLGAAESWVRGQGMAVIRGPLNFSTNQECGLLVAGFDEPPMVMMPYNPPGYAASIEACGYAKAMDLFAYIADDKLWEAMPRRVVRVAEKAARNAGIRVRPADIRQFQAEIQRVKEVYNRAWEHNWGFVPMTEHEFDHLAADLKPVLDPNLIFLAETADGTPIGVSLALPDLHQALKWSGGGHMFPLGLLKFLWYKRKIDQARLLTMGVVEEYRGRGIEALFFVETVRAALEHGYKRIEGSWVLETNTMMNRTIERLGAPRYKTYRIYEKSLA